MQYYIEGTNGRLLQGARGPPGDGRGDGRPGGRLGGRASAGAAPGADDTRPGGLLERALERVSECFRKFVRSVPCFRLETDFPQIDVLNRIPNFYSKEHLVTRGIS